MTVNSTNSSRRRSQGSKACRWGANCRRGDCRFTHPFQSQAKKSVGTNNRGACKFGNRCTRVDCWYVHPSPRQCPETSSSIVLGTTPPTPSLTASATHSKNITNSTTVPSSSASSAFGIQYQFCSPEECHERQQSGQISIFEATVETANLPLSRRRLDPCLAVARYRRSAAGTLHTAHSKATLQALLRHLIQIASTGQATPNHPPIVLENPEWNQPWSDFLVDRLRACQADATRLFGSSTPPLDLEWHVQMARVIIWVRYWMPRTNAFLEQTLTTNLTTVMEHYWTTTTTITQSSISPSLRHQWDDEMLCYAVISHLIQGDALDSILLEYSRHVPEAKGLTRQDQEEDYPLFRQALQLSCHMVRQEYLFLIRTSLSILAKCCLAPNLSPWRYQQCQQYNLSFAKEEAVKDLDQLLQVDLDTWSPEYVQQEFGLPCQSCDEEQGLAVIMKQVAMPLEPIVPQDPKVVMNRREERWVLGSFWDKNEKMGIPVKSVTSLLLHGHISSHKPNESSDLSPQDTHMGRKSADYA